MLLNYFWLNFFLFKANLHGVLFKESFSVSAIEEFAQ
jgi:hypothetical protein